MQCPNLPTTCPTVTQPTLDAGVADAACGMPVQSTYVVTGAALNSDPAKELRVTWILAPWTGTNDHYTCSPGPLGSNCNAVCNSQSGSSCVREGLPLVTLQSNCAFQMAPLAARVAWQAAHLIRRMRIVSLDKVQLVILTTMPRSPPVPSHATQTLIASYKLSARALNTEHS